MIVPAILLLFCLFYQYIFSREAVDGNNKSISNKLMPLITLAKSGSLNRRMSWEYLASFLLVPIILSRPLYKQIVRLDKIQCKNTKIFKILLE